MLSIGSYWATRITWSFSFPWISIVFLPYILEICVIIMPSLQIKLTVCMVSKPLRDRAGIWTQGYILSTARILPWVSRESGGAIVGEEEMRHSSWMCWVWGTRETSRRRAEFGTWGRSYMKEKEFVFGSYIVRLSYSEHQSIWLTLWNFQMGILAAHPQGCFLACLQFARPIFKSCNQGFLVLTCRLLSPPCVPAVLSPFFWRDFANCCPIAGCQDVPLRGIKHPWPCDPNGEKKKKPSVVWSAENGEHAHGEGNGFFKTGRETRGKQGVWEPGKAVGPHVKKRSSAKLLIHPTSSLLSFPDFK